MYEFNTKVTIVQLLRLTILSAKSKIYSPRQGYFSPGNAIVLEIEIVLLFISVTNSCRFWGSFVEVQARFQQTWPPLRWFSDCQRTPSRGFGEQVLAGVVIIFSVS